MIFFWLSVFTFTTQGPSIKDFGNLEGSRGQNFHLPTEESKNMGEGAIKKIGEMWRRLSWMTHSTMGPKYFWIRTRIQNSLRIHRIKLQVYFEIVTETKWGQTIFKFAFQYLSTETKICIRIQLIKCDFIIGLAPFLIEPNGFVNWLFHRFSKSSASN